ncbi:MAG: dihydropteroate synthase [Oceanospirillaceae bacterium]|nr:dihydropteroate synthase [Oceanospirillaceae bacterium]
MALLKCAHRSLDLSRTQVMGILNVTPDSFSDGGQLYRDQSLLLGRLQNSAAQMVKDGATILDLGGESTRPDAKAVSVQQEMDRVLPALEMLVANIDVVISIDTSSAALMIEAAKLGAGMINDVRALTREGALEAVIASGLPVCLMHMQGSPKNMQRAPEYQNVVQEVSTYLLQRAQLCEAQGMSKEQILLDPGFGFGKTLQQNLQLLKATAEFVSMGYPLLIGTSRKSMFGELLARGVNDRLAGGLASVAYAVLQGAAVVRVHDVKETVDVVKVIQAVQGESGL